MTVQRKEITFDRFIRGTLTAAGVIGILYLLDRLSGVLLPFFIAWLIAYITYPMVIFYQYKLRMRSRVVSILAVMLTLAAIGTAISLFFIPPMIEECIKMKELLGAYLQNGNGQTSIPEAINEFIHNNICIEARIRVARPARRAYRLLLFYAKRMPGFRILRRWRVP